MAAQKPTKREFVIRVPKNDGEKRFSILKFNDSLNVDPVNWLSSEIRMSREDNKREAMAGVAEQDYGEGSIYGRAAREEARRKKYGRRRREYEHDSQPWQLSINGRKLRSMQEGGAGEFADYWVFLKIGDDFQAHKIADWHQFLPCITHKTLDSEQAEEKFQQRNKVMNQFALKAQILQELKDQDVVGVGSGSSGKGSSLKIKDEMSSDDDDGEDADKDLDDDGARKNKLKKKKAKKGDAEKKKDKRQRVENADDVAAYESEDGQDEGREYDYMSDSGSDTDREEKTADEKVDEALVAVGDEAGLKGLIGSDLDTTSDEDEEKDEDNEETNEKPVEKPQRRKKQSAAESGNNARNGGNADEDEKESSDSDSDDPDSGNINSVFFMQRKDIRKRTADERSADVNASQSSSTAGNAADSGASEPTSKRQKIEERPCEMPQAQLSAHGAADALDEDLVRRLLLRKPHTTKELLNKVKPRCGPMSKAEIVAKLAVILKKIEPYQFRQKVDKKEVLYFSLNQTA